MALYSIGEIAKKALERAGATAQQAGPKPAYDGNCTPNCPVCYGLGWVRRDLEPGQDGFGKLILCPRSPAKAENLRKTSGLTESELGMTWADVQSIGGGLRLSPLFRGMLERRYGLVYVWGEWGLSKTFCMKVAVAEAVRAGMQAAYANTAAILDEIRDGYDEKDPREKASARMERWMAADVLAIDEADRFQTTPWAIERFFRLIDRRHVGAYRQESVTMIASNKSPEDAFTDPAFASRMRDSRHQVIHVTGKSVRPMMPKDFAF